MEKLLSYIGPVLALLAFIFAPIIGWYKHIMQRLDTLEQEMNKKVSKEEAKELLETRIQDMKDDITEIKTSINLILNNLISKK